MKLGSKVVVTTKDYRTIGGENRQVLRTSEGVFCGFSSESRAILEFERDGIKFRREVLVAKITTKKGEE